MGGWGDINLWSYANCATYCTFAIQISVCICWINKMTLPSVLWKLKDFKFLPPAFTLCIVGLLKGEGELRGGTRPDVETINSKIPSICFSLKD